MRSPSPPPWPGPSTSCSWPGLCWSPVPSTHYRQSESGPGREGRDSAPPAAAHAGAVDSRAPSSPSPLLRYPFPASPARPFSRVGSRGLWTTQGVRGPGKNRASQCPGRGTRALALIHCVLDAGESPSVCAPVSSSLNRSVGPSRIPSSAGVAPLPQELWAGVGEAPILCMPATIDAMQAE